MSRPTLKQWAQRKEREKRQRKKLAARREKERSEILRGVLICLAKLAAEKNA